jgi:hypothetical protein
VGGTEIVGLSSGGELEFNGGKMSMEKNCSGDIFYLFFNLLINL